MEEVGIQVKLGIRRDRKRRGKKARRVRRRVVRKRGRGGGVSVGHGVGWKDLLIGILGDNIDWI